MKYKEKKFDIKISVKNKSDIFIRAKERISDNTYDDSWLTISPETLNMLIDKLNDYVSLEQMSLKEKFINNNDKVRIAIRGSDINPVITINCVHINKDNEQLRGVISIPFLPFNEELAYYYLGPFLEKLKKYAE